jgi:cytochrome c5
MKRFICVLTTCYLLAACGSNKEEPIADVCSTANVSYTGTIASIINANGCLGCHSGATPHGRFALQNYDQVKAKALQTRSGTSVLYGAVAHMTGFAAMPQGGTKLSSCDQAKIKAWIDAGAPQ